MNAFMEEWNNLTENEHSLSLEMEQAIYFWQPIWQQEA